ncbi:MAG: SRPBCC family protein [Phycisphaerales bacterium JB043]
MHTQSITFSCEDGAFLLRAAQDVQGSLEDVFAFFEDPRNLERITPPLLRFRIIDPGSVHIHEGALINYRLRVRGIPIRWRTRITNWNPPHSFTDIQERGPYRLWEHTHTFEQLPRNTVRCSDAIRYKVLTGPIANTLIVRNDLKKIFTHRQRIIAQHFAQQATPSDQAPAPV